MKILAATDLSEDTRHMVDFTAKLVKQCGSKMYLLHLVPPCVMDINNLLPHEDFTEGLATDVSPILNCPDTLLKSTDARVKKLADEVRDKWKVPIYGKAEESDDLIESLNDFCERHKIDMLVINNRQHSLLGSLLLGNTTERIMRHSRIPIVVVPSTPL